MIGIHPVFMVVGSIVTLLGVLLGWDQWFGAFIELKLKGRKMTDGHKEQVRRDVHGIGPMFNPHLRISSNRDR